MKIRNIQGEFAEVEAGRVMRRVNVQMLSGVKPGDYVLVHAGFAIEKVNPDKARATLKLVSQMKGP